MNKNRSHYLMQFLKSNKKYFILIVLISFIIALVISFCNTSIETSTKNRQ
jgi:hypothetical protein